MTDAVRIFRTPPQCAPFGAAVALFAREDDATP